MSASLRWKKYPSGTESAYLEIYHNGETTYEFLGIKILKDDTKRKDKRLQAKQIRDKWNHQLSNDQHGIISQERRKACFLVYYQAFLDDYEKKGIRKYQAAFNKFKAYLKYKNKDKERQRIPFGQVTESLCKGFRDYLTTNANLTGETPLVYLKKIRSVLHQAVRDGYLRTNPCVGLSIKKPQDSIKKDILTTEEIQRLAITPCGNESVKRGFLFACFTGLGETEIIGLKWKHIVNDRLVTKRAKNNEPINNKLSATALSLIGERGKREDYIFKFPTSTAVSKNLKLWCKKAEIDKHITFYCGRHSFAIMALENGTNLKVLADLMGHSSIRFTTKYLNHVSKPKDEAIDNLPNIII